MERRGEKGRGLRELKDVYTARVLHDWLSKNAGERKRAKALSRFGRARRRVRRGEAIFASGNPVFQRQSRFLVIFDCAAKRYEQNWKGVAGGAESAGICGFPNSETATAQIENSRRGARQERHSLVHQHVKNTSLTC